MKTCVLIQTCDKYENLWEGLQLSYNFNWCWDMEFPIYILTEEKDFTLSHLKKYSFNQVMIDELDKCILLCSICHREIHGEQMNSRYPRQDSNL